MSPLRHRSALPAVVALLAASVAGARPAWAEQAGADALPGPFAIAGSARLDRAEAVRLEGGRAAGLRSGMTLEVRRDDVAVATLVAVLSTPDTGLALVVGEGSALEPGDVARVRLVTGR